MKLRHPTRHARGRACALPSPSPGIARRAGAWSQRPTGAPSRRTRTACRPSWTGRPSHGGSAASGPAAGALPESHLHLPHPPRQSRQTRLPPPPPPNRPACRPAAAPVAAWRGPSADRRRRGGIRRGHRRESARGAQGTPSVTRACGRGAHRRPTWRRRRPPGWRQPRGCGRRDPGRPRRSRRVRRGSCGTGAPSRGSGGFGASSAGCTPTAAARSPTRRPLVALAP
mmetsp:Transcript_19302/g.57292  ORF Transcript_19302/g.57292 Transcript_19302/m.57292 type:complete len:227 (-) Transcript_19302:477-1157(-)